MDDGLGIRADSIGSGFRRNIRQNVCLGWHDVHVLICSLAFHSPKIVDIVPGGINSRALVARSPQLKRIRSTWGESKDRSHYSGTKCKR
jgi:hypothetical protein